MLNNDPPGRNRDERVDDADNAVRDEFSCGEEHGWMQKLQCRCAVSMIKRKSSKNRIIYTRHSLRVEGCVIQPRSVALTFLTEQWQDSLPLSLSLSLSLSFFKRNLIFERDRVCIKRSSAEFRDARHLADKSSCTSRGKILTRDAINNARNNAYVMKRWNLQSKGKLRT